MEIIPNSMDVDSETKLPKIEIETKKDSTQPIQEREGYTLKRGHEARKQAEQEGLEFTWPKKKKRRCGKNKNKNAIDGQNVLDRIHKNLTSSYFKPNFSRKNRTRCRGNK